MPADDDRQLKWVQANRTPAVSWASVAELCGALLKGPSLRGPAWKRRLIGVLEEHAGPELLSRVEGIEVRRGVLRLQVAEPAVRYELGLRWEQRLRAVLQAQLPEAGVIAVRFVTSR
ncbi:MAG TPA: DciA family protein [Phycisphaerae bacterium]|jgi:hypothetical protein|nr:DUF721 domain-containing protein [Phycisphaerae bacterium]HOB74432.1 DciA family protein [Phycisphaerae bacterium]HOJ54260.1 DciA family protein [Phycisphaerae bacterium]HOL26731.1 DciA family protein [Phycisphaerae bacterium]HPP20617.1 DciA family protein [Phycisphaerae bacterium]